MQLYVYSVIIQCVFACVCMQWCVKSAHMQQRVDKCRSICASVCSHVCKNARAPLLYCTTVCVSVNICVSFRSISAAAVYLYLM